MGSGVSSDIVNPTKPDIATHDDVKRLVDHFYGKIRSDALLAPIFGEVAQVDWEVHLPIMVQFWESLLLGAGTYSGRPFPKHYGLPVTQAHFIQWLTLFRSAVDDCFAGPKADEAKLRALAIADTFAMRMNVLENPVALRDAVLPEGDPLRSRLILRGRVE